MRWFLDTEFIEKPKDPILGNPYHYLQLISIGLVSDTGKTYYAINEDYSSSEANDWVRENVIAKLEPKSTHGYLYKSIPEIKADLLQLFGAVRKDDKNSRDGFVWEVKNEPEIWAYFADYDWVIFCSIFGSMIELPRNMPMFCRDLKQLMETKGLTSEWKRKTCPDPEGEHNALVDAKWNLQLFDAIQKNKKSI